MIPILIQTSNFTLYTYPLFLGLSWGIGYHIAENLFLKFQQPLKKLYLLFSVIFIASFVGAKIFFVTFSRPENAYELLTNSNFWMGGGFVFYGGLIFGVISVWLLLQLKLTTKNQLKLLIPPLVIGHAVGRVGCFLSGCCFGKMCDLWHARHPTQLYEAVFLIVLGIYLYKKMSNNFESVLSTYLISYSSFRFMVEFLRDDTVRGFYFGLSTSQWISIVLLLLGVGIKLIHSQGTCVPRE